MDKCRNIAQHFKPTKPHLREIGKKIAKGLLAISLGLNLFATPTIDECTQGSGCITPSGGGTATFNFTASFDIDTHSQNGTFTYTDSSISGLTLSSSTLLEYSVVPGGTSRAFSFALTGSPYAQARIFVTDNGASGDTAQVQLLDAADTPIYDTLSQTLRADCGGGITLGGCVVPSPCQLEVTAGCAMVVGNQTATLDSCEIIGNSAEVDFYYTIKNAGASPVALSSLTGSDTFGSLDLSELGTGSLAVGQQVTLVVRETVSGPFPFVNSVTFMGGSGQCSDMATVTVKQKIVPPNPPPQDCDDFVTGGGWIFSTKCLAKANFGIHGGIRKGAFWGGLNFLDHAIGMHIKSTAVTDYKVLSDVCRQINFNVTIDGSPGTAIVKVCDNGEPGRNDTFDIQVSNGYKVAGDLGGSRPGGGNIQLHQKCDTGNDNGHDQWKCPHKNKCNSKAECDRKPKDDDKDKFNCPHKEKCNSKAECDRKPKDDDKDKFNCPHKDKCKTKSDCDSKTKRENDDKKQENDNNKDRAKSDDKNKKK